MSPNSLFLSSDFPPLDNTSCSEGGKVDNLWSSVNSQQPYSSQEEKPEIAAEICLSPELLQTLHRRGRRRLYEIREQFKVNIQFQRSRGVLLVHGTEEAIKDAHRYLEVSTPTRKEVVEQVWAELMRTRTIPEVARSAIANIQEQSNSRVHVDRSFLEVQIFGTSDGVAIAKKMLDDLQQECTQEVVPLKGARPYAAKLEHVADAFNVTLNLGDTFVVVMGKCDAVALAAKELRQYVANPDLLSMEDMGDSGFYDNALSNDEKSTMDPSSSSSGSLPRLEKDQKGGMILTSPMPPSPGISGHNNLPPRARSTINKGGHSFGTSSAPGMGYDTVGNNLGYCVASFCVNCGSSVTGNFCSQCGHAVPNAQGLVAGSSSNMMPMQNGMMPVAAGSYMVPAGMSNMVPADMSHNIPGAPPMQSVMPSMQQTNGCMTVMQPWMNNGNMVFQMVSMPSAASGCEGGITSF